MKYTDNLKLFETITAGLVRNVVEHGNYYCPCKLEIKEDNICPCKEQREEGICHCGLFEER